MRQIKHALVPSPKRRADTEKAARVAGNVRENEESADTRARAGIRDERRERAREDVATSWRMARADMVGCWREKETISGMRVYTARLLPNKATLRNLKLMIAHGRNFTYIYFV